MIVRLNKDKFAAIEGAFLMLKEDKLSDAPKAIIKENLENVFDGYKFTIRVVETSSPKISFIMSVFPEVDTASKIVSAMLTGHEEKIISDLWKKNTKWVIEIDSKILDSNINFTNKELTALLLHEVGHITITNSIPTRLYTIMSYEVAKTRASNKALIKDELFRSIMSLPILDACVSDKAHSSIKDEIKADKFAKKMGYSNELYSALTKITNVSRGSSPNDDISKLTNFSLSTLRDLQERRTNLVKKELTSLSEACDSPYIKDVIDTFVEKVLVQQEGTFIDKNEYIWTRINDDISSYYTTEFFGITKSLKRIEPADIDYVMIKMEGIKSETDKLMLITYIHSKLDLIDYYISILENPKLSRKYSIPNSIQQLKGFRERLMEYREAILKYRIPDKFKGVMVAWPEGYEG